tara:strand:+ start:350 stop:1666 length:1317 start_codon:yes stop_codon:yes gene_type:complete
MGTETTIMREAAEIEARKLGLMDSAKNLADKSIDLPDQKVAGLTSSQNWAGAQTGQAGGIGGYRALAQGGYDTMNRGLGSMGQALGALGQAGQTLQGSYGQYGGGPGYQAGQYGGGPGYQAGQYQAGPGYQSGQYQAGPGYDAQGFDPNSVSSYMNPYEDQAVQSALGDIRREGTIAGNQQDAGAVAAGAFGGSRQALQSSELGRNVLDQQARTAVGMRQAGYQNAMQQAQGAFADQQRRAQSESQFGTQMGQQAFENQQRRAQSESQFGTQIGQQSFEDQQRRAQAQSQFLTTSGQQAFEDQQRRRQSGAQMQTGIASGYGNIGQATANIGAQQMSAAQQAQQQGLAEMGAASQYGALQRQVRQQGLDADYANQSAQAYEPYTRLGFLSDIYKGAPSSQSILASKTGRSPSMFQQAAGAATGILGAAYGAKNIGKLF